MIPFPKVGDVTAAGEVLDRRLEAAGGTQIFEADGGPPAPYADFADDEELMEVVQALTHTYLRTARQNPALVYDVFCSLCAQGLYLGAMTERLRWQAQQAESGVAS